MGKKEPRRLREGDYAFEPVEKPDHRHVVCDYCGQKVLKKKAKRLRGDWACPECREN